MAQQPTSSALRALALEFKSLQEEPVEGFRVKLVIEDNLFEWEVAIFGPPETLYEGGYFKQQMLSPMARYILMPREITQNSLIRFSLIHDPDSWLDFIDLSMPNRQQAHVKFPPDYPYSPPSIRFLTKVWHPNVYENGDLCISILHPPIDDPQSGELPCERWNPTQNVRTILLSVISLLNEPNTFSPANVDASVMYRRWKESKGKDKEYENIIRKQVTSSRSEAEKDDVVVPTTLEEYCIKHRVKPRETEMTDFYDDDYGDDMDEEEEEDEEYNDDNEDSGNGES